MVKGTTITIIGKSLGWLVIFYCVWCGASEQKGMHEQRITHVQTRKTSGVKPDNFDEASLFRELKKLHESGVPGVVFAWQQGEQLPVFSWSGVANAETREMIQREHMVRAGGILKMAIGTLVLILSDEGLLSLEDPVSRYVEGVPMGNQITIRMLGNHTSGLCHVASDTHFLQELLAKSKRAWSPSEVLSVTYAKGLISKPGRKFHYSDSNTILLAEVIEKVTGRRWHEVLQQRVLRKLGAVHARVPSNGWFPRSQPGLRGYGYVCEKSPLDYGRTFKDVTVYDPSWMGAAGDWVTNVHDLLALARPLAKGVLLSERMRAEQRSWVRTGIRSMRYGFCLAEWDGDILGHAGEAPGFATFVGWKSRGDVSVVAWTNLSNLIDKTNPAEKLGLSMLGAK